MITASAIAVGFNHNHSCAIQAGTGAVVCWGRNVSGQATPPPSVDGATGTASAIAAGGFHSCAIQAATGAVVCWGNDSWGQATPPPPVNGAAGMARAIAVGVAHSCAIQAGTGAVVCWGFPNGPAMPPPSVDGTAGTASAIAVGDLHTLAIRSQVCADGDSDGDGVCDASDNCLVDANSDQRDTNLDGYGNLCDLDADQSGAVGGADANALRMAFGFVVGDPHYDPDLDSDGNGAVDGSDFSNLRSHFGKAPGPSGLACAGTIPCP